MSVLLPLGADRPENEKEAAEAASGWIGPGDLLRPRVRWRLPEGAETHTAQAGRDHGSDEPAAARLDQIPTS